MADRVEDYFSKSLAKFLKTNVSGLLDAKVISPDFDYNTRPDPSNVTKHIGRELPFATIRIITGGTKPATIGNILYDAELLLDIGIFAANGTALRQHTADMRQSLHQATGPGGTQLGVTLYNYQIVSGSYYATAGALQLQDMEDSNYIPPEEVAEGDNRKYSTHTIVTFAALKDVNAVLLENLGRINVDNSDV